MKKLIGYILLAIIGMAIMFGISMLIGVWYSGFVIGIGSASISLLIGLVFYLVIFAEDKKPIHLFHKWKTIKTQKGTVTGEYFRSKQKVDADIVAELQECTFCEKRRGVIYFADNRKYIVHPSFIED